MLTYQTLPARHVSEFAVAVREGLLKPRQRELPSKYLYDEVGSALFEAICLLPEYGLTRGRRAITANACAGNCGAAALSDSCSGAGEAGPEKDALDFGGAIAPATNLLFSN